MIAFLIDADNLSAPEWIEEAVQTLESSEGPIAIRRAYGSSENLKGLADTLRNWAIRPYANLPLTKNTTDMSLAVDAMELACLMPRPKLIAIGSGDLDFVPLVVRLRERGIKIVCISERSKMAADAVCAYDQVIYVTGNQGTVPRGRIEVDKTVLTKEEVSPPKKQAIRNNPTVKIETLKQVPAKKVVPKKNSKQPSSAATTEVTLAKILAAAPGLQAGKWLLLNNVAKVLRDENLIGKSVASTKLFRKFPLNFELSPDKKPNRVRFIQPQK